MRLILNRASWLVAASAIALLFSISLRTEFLQDDFGWLNLGTRFDAGESLWKLLFAPMAQGTVRTLSERIPFLVSATLAGLDSVPLRAFHVALSALNLWIWYRWLRLKNVAAALSALVLTIWYLNASLVKAHIWTSALNQTFQSLMIGVCLLLGARKSRLTLPVLVASFFVHELCIFIPVYLVASEGRSIVKTSLWRASVALSVVFVVLSRVASSNIATVTYRIVVSPASFATSLKAYSVIAWPYGSAALVAALLLIAGCIAIGRNLILPHYRLPLAFMLPLVLYCCLPNIQNGYYLMIPLLGISLSLGLLLRDLGRHNTLLANGGILACLLLLGLESRTCFPMLQDFQEQTNDFSGIIGRVLVEAKRDKTAPVIVSGLGRRGYFSGWSDDPLRLFGLDNVYLSPEEPMEITDPYEPVWFHSRFVDGQQLRRLMISRKAAFLHIDNGSIDILSDAELLRLSRLEVKVGFRTRRLGSPIDVPETADRGLGTISSGFSWVEETFALGVPTDAPNDPHLAFVAYLLTGDRACSLALLEKEKELRTIPLSPGWGRYDIGSVNEIQPGGRLSGHLAAGCKVGLREIHFLERPMRSNKLGELEHSL